MAEPQEVKVVNGGLSKLAYKREGQQLAFVEVGKIWWKDRFRTDLGDIDSLADSMKEKGVLQPITITPEYELLAGQRRITAAKKATLTHIPCLIRKREDTLDAREIELMENVFRKNFSWDEEAALVRDIDRLYKEQNIDWSGRKTAQLLGKGVASVSRALQLANAADIIPELREMKTADDAFRTLKKMEEEAVVTELRSRQVSAMKDPSGKYTLAKGVKRMLEIADGNYKIGDCFKGLAELRTNGVFTIIECDPPYGIDLPDVKSSKDSVGSTVTGYNEVGRDQYPVFLSKLTKELFRVAATHSWLVFWFGPTWQHTVLTSLREAGWHVDEIPAIWTKAQGQTLQPEYYFARGYEPFYLCRKGNPVLMKRGRLNIFDFPGIAGMKKYHPTQRPTELIQEILETLGIPTSFVLVPFLGSGATLRAAYNLGMSAMGFDLDGKYKDKFLLAVEEDTKALDNDTN